MHTSMSGLKRRHSNAFSDADTVGSIIGDTINGKDRTEVESEEHFEAIEQMPLSLHRQFSLMRELDQQVHGYNAALLPTVQKYIQKRKAILRTQMPADTATEADETDRPTKSEQPPTPLTPFPLAITPLRKQRTEFSATPRTSTPMGVPPERAQLPETTRGMLSHIAWLSEELLRASEENSQVDRHIRLLDQAIQEHETSGTQTGNGINLPDLVVPRWARPTRATLSPMGDGESDLNVHETSSAIAPQNEPKGRRKKGAPNQKVQQLPVNVNSSKCLKITLPPTIPTDVPSDEPRYCYCDRISFGEMIACDASKCNREWFHLGCAGLSEIPKGKWYCTECTARKKQRRK
ncbi:hypothetical protein BD779DRAFT_1510177 [Infundibulicybe gibba]|nr:hypothetical protein BD779DRAFT_1510177 [Infundibulicybe gibba]